MRIAVITLRIENDKETTGYRESQLYRFMKENTASSNLIRSLGCFFRKPCLVFVEKVKVIDDGEKPK